MTQNAKPRHKNTFKPKTKVNCKNYPHVSVYHCAQLLYTAQHITVLIIFPFNLQMNIIARVLSTGGEKNMQQAS